MQQSTNPTDAPYWITGVIPAAVPERPVLFGDDASAIFTVPTDPDLEALRALPWQKHPNAWELCPICAGEGGGCGECGGCGHVHVKRLVWLFNRMLHIEHLISLVEDNWLGDERLPHRTRRSHEWMVARAAAAESLLRRWAAEDGHPDDLARVHTFNRRTARRNA